ncbi:erythroid differentiation-related factor 1 [Euwallacea fornicatus]|uniref:erythroid differentiation-related factor 1 n=1 Tax=Euwallacea fornicatus TaxID=995702 RepID=UPI00338F7CA5
MSEEHDNIEPQSSKERTDQEKVKSRAVVKYSAPKPATFAKLQFNTDLNLPPSNWLSSSADSYGLQRVIHQQKGFSSFRMAHMFPDCVGEVDVVSDAENIKNLLKIPYSKSHISMVVHRVENTLLLDEFDIYKYLLKTSETEWEWLKKFFFENVDRETYEEDKHLYIKNRTQKALKQKSLVSKFLYHSLVEGEKCPDQEVQTSNSPWQHYPLQPTQSNTLQTPPLPDPTPSPECPDPHPFEFNRNVAWTFEDIEMLLGTDMPIFGGGTHPCISLRLRDMNKPISVLTGIDYWLDNLMSNVPEVVMCYHLNGIVQKYELVKTEDLPRLDNSKFSPKLIRDVAQSILSFLKSNATKAGHTYWLFKGKDEEVVKLYDLTSLCPEEDFQKGQNPFTIPVAMLLYRVARNMKQSPDRSQHGTIRMLLKNTVKLLPEEKYPEIVTSSHYMLADLYLPAEIDPENPNFERFEREDDEASVYDDDEDLNDGNSVAVLDLEKRNHPEKFRNNYKPPSPVTGSPEERCIQAIGHVVAGLNCLQYFNEKNDNDNPSDKEEEVPMAKSFEPIPMPYAKLGDELKINLSEIECSSRSSKRPRKKDKKKKNKDQDQMALLPKDPSNASYHPKWPTFDPNTISWKGHLKTLLLEKAALAYATLAEHHITQGRYGECLRVLGLLFRCQLALDRTGMQNGNGALRLSCLLGRAGDACLMIVKHWVDVDIYKEQLHSHRDEDVRLLEKLEQDERMYRVSLGDSAARVVLIPDIRTLEQMLLKTVKCYETANQISQSESISFRLANSLNEVASYYLQISRQAKTSKDIIDACNNSEPYLTKGLHIFERIHNDANIALLNSNMGHLHRLMAHAHTPTERGELTPAEKKHYNKAFQSYKRALRVIGDRKDCPAIWDAVTWELSTALFVYSSIMYENPPSDVSKAEAEKQVLEALKMALDHCDLDETNTKFPLYQYRAATLHFKIGSLWHSHVWDTPAADTKKHTVQLVLKNYEKAVKLFFQSGDAIYYLTCQMQRVALAEQFFDCSTSPSAKLKHLQTCLEYFLEIDELLESLINKKLELSEDQKEGENEKPFQTGHSLLKLVKNRLQHCLKSLVKVCVSKCNTRKDLAEKYKACYKATFGLSDDLDYDRMLNGLHKALGEIADLNSNVD